MLQFVTVDTPQQFGTGDGTTAQFQLLDGSTLVSVPVQENIYRTDWQGTQLLYATPRTNLALQSRNNGSPTWAYTGASVSPGQASPNGDAGAYALVEDTSSATHNSLQVVSGLTSGAQYTYQQDIAPLGRTAAAIELSQGSNVAMIGVDLTLGALLFQTLSGSWTDFSYDIAPLNNGWCRLSVTVNINGSASVAMRVLAMIGSSETYTGTGIPAVAIDNAQLTPGSAASSAISTTTTPVTVVDYAMLPGGIVSLSGAPLVDAILDWTGKYSLNVPDTFPGTPLQSVVPAYLYQQYADDPDLQSFFSALNTTSQGYVDWFNQTPLSVYTNASINGPLLDWIGQGLYGISRPVISTLTTTTSGEVNGAAINTLAINRHFIRRSGTVSTASDDIYKRVLTWHTYIGDGRQMSVQWLRRRVARFIYGENGTDIPVDYLSWISISQPSLPSIGTISSAPINTAAVDILKHRNQLASHAIEISIPSNAIGQAFQVLAREGYIALPFQVRILISLTSAIRGPSGALDSNFVLGQSALA